MEPGFLHLGPRELAAVWLAVVIIVDWAATRYGAPRGGRRRAAPEPAEDPPAAGPPATRG